MKNILMAFAVMLSSISAQGKMIPDFHIDVPAEKTQAKSLSKNEKALTEFIYKTSELYFKTQMLQVDPNFIFPYQDKLNEVKATLSSVHKEYEYSTYIAYIGRYIKKDEQKTKKATKALFTKLGKDLGISVYDPKRTIADQVKIIEKEYEKFTPQFKNDSSFQAVFRWIFCNEDIDLSAMGSHFQSYQIENLITAVLAYQAGDGKEDVQTKILYLSLLGAYLSIKVSFQTFISPWIRRNMKGQKEFLELKKAQKKNEKIEKDNKHFALKQINYNGNGEGFARIEGVQDEKTIKVLKEFKSWLNSPLSNYQGGLSSEKRSLILFGEPGNGKSLMAEALSDETGVPVIKITAKDIQNEKVFIQKIQIGEYIASQQDKKSVIYLLDEIDLSINSRASSQSNSKAQMHALQTILGQLQANNDSQETWTRKVFMLATNYIKHIDPAVLRSERARNIVEIKNPNFEQRRNMFKALLQFNDPEITEDQEEFLSNLAKETDGFCRADIAQSFRMALENMATRSDTDLTSGDFKIAFETIQSNKSSFASLKD